MPPPSLVTAVRIASSTASRPAPAASEPAVVAASRPISAAASAASASQSPPFPLRRRGAAGRPGRRPGLADRLVHLGHLLYQRPEPLVLGHLPLGLLQLRAGPQVHVHRLAARPVRQVVLRPVTTLARLGASAVRLAALTPHRIQRPAAEVTDPAEGGIQPSAPGLQRGQASVVPRSGSGGSTGRSHPR